jgi:hypothetical protein
MGLTRVPSSSPTLSVTTEGLSAPSCVGRRRPRRLSVAPIPSNNRR